MTLQHNQPKNLQIPIRHRELFQVFSIVFLFILFESVFVRSILLPHVLPSLHAGAGFMSGGDSVGYHELAVQIAERITTEGWSSWQLRPSTGEATLATPAGIASGIYAIFGPNPMFLMPLNALIHALSCACLYIIFLTLFNNKIAALISLIPFGIFPTAIFWNSQLLKDGISILGSYVYLTAWVLLIRRDISSNKKIIYAITLATAGFILIWSVRSYLVIVFTYLSLVLGTTILLFELFQKNKFSEKVIRFIQFIFFIFFLVSLGSVIKNLDPGPKITDWSGQEAQHQVKTGRVLALANVPKHTKIDECRDNFKCNQDKQIKNFIEENNIDASEGSKKTNQIENELNLSCNKQLICDLVIETKKCEGWTDSTNLPSVINQLLLKIIIVRDGYFDNVYGSASTTVDRDVCITNPFQLVVYLPRAFQLGLFAPFPLQWIEKAKHGGLATRLIAGGEMLVVYIAIFGLIIFSWKYRTKIQFWLLIEFSLFMILLNTIVTPNIGSLYRMRFGFLMLLVGMGVGATFIALNKRKESQ